VLTLDNWGHVSDVTTFGPNGLLSVSSGGVSGFYTFDPSGNTSQRLTGDGSVDYSHLTSGFGVQRVHDGKYDLYDGMGAQWGYRNINSDQVFLLGHRYYNTLYGGQFLTRDPMGYRGGINLYGYTRNNPVNRRDPRGYEGKWNGPGDEDGTSAEPWQPGQEIPESPTSPAESKLPDLPYPSEKDMPKCEAEKLYGPEPKEPEPTTPANYWRNIEDASDSDFAPINQAITNWWNDFTQGGISFSWG